MWQLAIYHHPFHWNSYTWCEMIVRKSWMIKAFWRRRESDTIGTNSRCHHSLYSGAIKHKACHAYLWHKCQIANAMVIVVAIRVAIGESIDKQYSAVISVFRCLERSTTNEYWNSVHTRMRHVRNRRTTTDHQPRSTCVHPYHHGWAKSCLVYKCERNRIAVELPPNFVLPHSGHCLSISLSLSGPSGSMCERRALCESSNIRR